MTGRNTVHTRVRTVITPGWRIGTPPTTPTIVPPVGRRCVQNPGNRSRQGGLDKLHGLPVLAESEDGEERFWAIVDQRVEDGVLVVCLDGERILPLGEYRFYRD